MIAKAPRWHTTTSLRQAWIVGNAFALLGLTLLALALTTGPDWLIGGALPLCGTAVPWLATAVALSRRRKLSPGSPGSSARAHPLLEGESLRQACIGSGHHQTVIFPGKAWQQ